MTVNHKTHADRPQGGDRAVQPAGAAHRDLAALSLPRVGFYTTPAFLALWNTNDSNQHRVTANQTLLVALGAVVHQREQRSRPLSTGGPRHAPRGRRHASATAATRAWIRCASSGPPSTTSTTATTSRRGVFKAAARTRGRGHRRRAGVRRRQRHGRDMLDARAAARTGRGDTADQPVKRFAIAMTQKLCFFANSAGCLESDPEFRRVARRSRTSNYDLHDAGEGAVLVAAGDQRRHTATTDQNGVTISIARRDQLCARAVEPAGHRRPLRAGACRVADAAPSGDAEDRHAASPPTPSAAAARSRSRRPTRRCSTGRPARCCARTWRAKVVDPSSGTGVYRAPTWRRAIADMVRDDRRLPARDPHHAPAVQILTDHYTPRSRSASTGSTTARQPTRCARPSRSACQSPTSLSFGL